MLRIKKYKPVSKKKEKKHNEIALLAKTNLDYIKSSISRSFTGSFTYWLQLFSFNRCVKYEDIIENRKKLETS